MECVIEAYWYGMLVGLLKTFWKENAKVKDLSG